MNSFLQNHFTGSTSNPYYQRYRQLVVKHAARPVLKAMKSCLKYDPEVSFCNDQRQEFVRVRYLACYLLKNHTEMSLNQIAFIISGGVNQIFDHSTVVHGIRSIEMKIEMIGTNGNRRPVCKETFELIENINHEIESLPIP